MSSAGDLEDLLFRARVKFDYDAEDDTELTIGAGEILAIFKTADNGWWFAEATDGACGWVPSNFLEKISELEEQSEYLEEEEPELMGSKEEEQEIHFSEAEIIEPDDIALNSTIQVKQENKKKDPMSHLAMAQAGQEACKACNRVFNGPYIMDSNERKYHEECFTCFVCDKSLLESGFVEKDGNLYCEPDFHKLFSPKCAHCQQPITNQYVKALGRTYHPDHFVCKVCSAPFTDGLVFQYADEPYCKTHYQELFAVKCGYCNKGILGKGFSIAEMEKSFHEECFFCNAPQKHLLQDGSAFHVHDDKLYCPQHFKEAILTKCYKCKKIIESDYLTVKDTNFHVECFKCEQCDISILDGKFSIFKDKFLCLFCAKKAKQDSEVSQPSKSTPEMPAMPSTVDAKKSKEAAAAKRAEPTMKYGSAEAHQANEGQVVPRKEESPKPAEKKTPAKQNQPPSVSATPPKSDNSSKASAAELLAEAAAKRSPTLTRKMNQKSVEFSPSGSKITSQLAVPKSDSPDSKSNRSTPQGSGIGSHLQLPSYSPQSKSKSADASPNGSVIQRNGALSPEAKGKSLFADAKRKSMMAKRPESFIDPAKQSVPYSALKSKDSIPDGVDPKCKEKYLSEEEFQSVFKMNREAFYAAPQWRQVKLKQDKGLF
jgi:paxillin